MKDVIIDLIGAVALVTVPCILVVLMAKMEGKQKKQ